MVASSKQSFDFTAPLGGVIRGAGSSFRVSCDQRQRTKAGETVADNDGEQDMFSAAAIAAE
jgi:hypothetical protein